jgi:hypothetical protein
MHGLGPKPRTFTKKVPDRLVCGECGAIVNRENIQRHYSVVHGGKLGESTPLNASNKTIAKQVGYSAGLGLGERIRASVISVAEEEQESSQALRNLITGVNKGGLAERARRSLSLLEQVGIEIPESVRQRCLTDFGQLPREVRFSGAVATTTLAPIGPLSVPSVLLITKGWDLARAVDRLLECTDLRRETVDIEIELNELEPKIVCLRDAVARLATLKASKKSRKSK